MSSFCLRKGVEVGGEMEELVGWEGLWRFPATNILGKLRRMPGNTSAKGYRWTTYR